MRQLSTSYKDFFMMRILDPENPGDLNSYEYQARKPLILGFNMTYHIYISEHIQHGSKTWETAVTPRLFTQALNCDTSLSSFRVVLVPADTSTTITDYVYR